MYHLAPTSNLPRQRTAHITSVQNRIMRAEAILPKASPRKVFEYHSCLALFPLDQDVEKYF